MSDTLYGIANDKSKVEIYSKDDVYSKADIDDMLSEVLNPQRIKSVDINADEITVYGGRTIYEIDGRYHASFRFPYPADLTSPKKILYVLPLQVAVARADNQSISIYCVPYTINPAWYDDGNSYILINAEFLVKDASTNYVGKASLSQIRLTYQI